MKKIILHEIGNDGNFNHYIFDKKQNVIEILLKIFLMDFDIYDIFETPDKKGNYQKINVKKLTDIHQGSVNEKLSIDIFYGKNKMFVAIVCSEKSRLKFNESLFKYFTMPKSKKIKSKRKIK